MAAKDYFAEVVEIKETRLTGRRINTSFQAAMHDCPALWEEFSREIDLTALSATYGVSIMTSPTSFDYLTAVAEADAPPFAGRPSAWQSFVLPAGTYLKCVCPGTDQLMEVYNFIYESAWLKENTKFLVDFAKPCFEEYTGEYMKSGLFHIYAPLKTNG